jgi:hypothetical protein
MHVVVLCALAGLAAGLAALEVLRPQPVARRRALRAAGLALLIALPLLSVAALREPLMEVYAGVLARGDVWAVVEHQALFAASPGMLPATELFGWYAFLIPLTPLLAALRARAGCPPQARVVLVAWTTVLALLAVVQVRYATDFAVAGSVVFAWTLAGVQDRVARRLPGNGRLATALAVAAGLTLLWPALGFHGRTLKQVLDHPRRVAPAAGARLSPEASLRAFAETVRSATPETSGFLEPGVRPEYGLLVPPDLGHGFLYAARRPVPANNFGPFLDAEKFHQANRFFYEVESEAEAVAIGERLRTRFVVSRAAVPRGLRPGAFLLQLYHRDGSATDARTHLERFRLIAEGPPGGTPRVSGRLPERLLERLILYKLFELVEGAVLEAKGEPGQLLVAEVRIATPLGRSFRFRAASSADSSGTARVRVPYATDVSTRARATGPYAVRIGGASWQVRVPDAAVQEGRVIRVSPAPETGTASDASPGPGE